MSVYFSMKYPNAKIIAVEAEESNFKQLCENTRNLPNIEAVHAAIYSHPGFTLLENPEDDEWSFRVKSIDGQAKRSLSVITEKSVQQIPTVMIQGLLEKAKHKSIDLLKLDIEGSELEVFQNDLEKWLPAVKVVNIELHDRFKPGCTEVRVSASNFVSLDTDKSAETQNKRRSFV